MPHMNIPFTHTEEEHPLVLKKKHMSLADRAADRMTEGMGSWSFLFVFSAIIIVWISLNLYGWWQQTDRDRLSARYDYAVNRKAEREIQLIQKELYTIKEMLTVIGEKKLKK